MKLLHDRPAAAPVRMNRPYPAPGLQEGLWTRLSLELPANLRMWFCDAVIACWIEQELNSLEEDWPASRGSLWQETDGEAAGMLSVLVFGYASLVFGSDEIAGACRSDPAFRRLGHDQTFFPDELRSFRRHHRPILELVLAGVFIRAITRKFGLTSALLPIELEQDLWQHASERLDLARHMDTNPATVW